MTLKHYIDIVTPAELRKQYLNRYLSNDNFYIVVDHLCKHRVFNHSIIRMRSIRILIKEIFARLEHRELGLEKALTMGKKLDWESQSKSVDVSTNSHNVGQTDIYKELPNVASQSFSRTLNTELDIVDLAKTYRELDFEDIYEEIENWLSPRQIISVKRESTISNYLKTKIVTFEPDTVGFISSGAVLEDYPWWVESIEYYVDTKKIKEIIVKSPKVWRVPETTTLTLRYKDNVYESVIIDELKGVTYNEVKVTITGTQLSDMSILGYSDGSIGLMNKPAASSVYITTGKPIYLSEVRDPDVAYSFKFNLINDDYTLGRATTEAPTDFSTLIGNNYMFINSNSLMTNDTFVVDEYKVVSVFNKELDKYVTRLNLKLLKGNGAGFDAYLDEESTYDYEDIVEELF